MQSDGGLCPDAERLKAFCDSPREISQFCKCETMPKRTRPLHCWATSQPPGPARRALARIRSRRSSLRLEHSSFPNGVSWIASLYFDYRTIAGRCPRPAICAAFRPSSFSLGTRPWRGAFCPHSAVGDDVCHPCSASGDCDWSFLSAFSERSPRARGSTAEQYNASRLQLRGLDLDPFARRASHPVSRPHIERRAMTSADDELSDDSTLQHRSASMRTPGRDQHRSAINIDSRHRPAVDGAHRDLSTLRTPFVCGRCFTLSNRHGRTPSFADMFRPSSRFTQ